MNWFWQLNLIHLFDFYLALALALGTWTRVRQYRAVLGLVRTVPGRWPKLFELVRKHWSVFLTLPTVAPALIALVLMILQTLASRLVWPDAGQPPFGLTVERLLEHRLAVPVVVLLGIGMVAFDTWGVLDVGEVDRQAIEKYFDQAEYWLRSWAAPVVHFFTLGYINPRKMVAVEVRNALVSATELLNYNLWWISVQIGLRIAFGLALWLTYALS